MSKEINEKTFELNITNELLIISKSFIWYLDHFHRFNFPHLRNKNIISNFLNQSTFFAEGLTQKEESDKLKGGYDVSINFKHPRYPDSRVMFLQYKAGERKLYSKNKESKFYKKTAIKESRDSEHIMFTFNDAADGTQHSTLRNLANTTGIKPSSVLYVFPRITEYSDFKSKIGNLIYNSSFVPVLEIDDQASNQTPPITIIDKESHKYRTSYNGITSEVNYFYFFFLYNNEIVTNLLSELICIQIERFATLLSKEESPLIKLFLEELDEIIKQFVDYELNEYSLNYKIVEGVKFYIKSIRENHSDKNEIPRAPSNYTTVLPKEGLRLNFDKKIDFSNLTYQIF